MDIILKSEVHPTVGSSYFRNSWVDIILKSEVHPTGSGTAFTDDQVDIILKSEVHPTQIDREVLTTRWISFLKMRYIQRTENYTLWYRGRYHLKK